MSKSFLSAPTNHKPSKISESAFYKAKQAWDTRIGDSVVRAKNWRIAFFVQSILTLMMLTLLIIISNKREVIPILVGMDKNTGERTALGKVEEGQYLPGALEVKYFLTQFIRFVRAVPTDPVVIKQNWLRAYTFLRKDAAGLLNELTNSETASPLKQIGKKIVSIQPLSVVEIPETNSYQLRWQETVYSNQGTKLDQYTMLGTFVIEFELPKNEQQINENPLGLYIKNFQWNREL